jgi:hypothetical protein
MALRVALTSHQLFNHCKCMTSAFLHQMHTTKEVVWRLQAAVFTSTELCAPVTICLNGDPLIALQSLVCNISEHMFACQTEP